MPTAEIRIGHSGNLVPGLWGVRDNRDMYWYTWVFSGVGAAIAVPVVGWILARFPRKPPASAVAGPQGDAALSSASATPSVSNTTAGTSLPPVAATPVMTAAPGTSSPDGPPPAALVDFLLAIPEMSDPAFRQLLYSHLPKPVAQQLRMDKPARIELIGLIDTFSRYPQLRPWQSLLERMAVLLPMQSAVEQLATELARLGLVGNP